jgi:ABC-type nitrate/sulfonate/bicarbonate transport system substrate-binding protein
MSLFRALISAICLIATGAAADPIKLGYLPLNSHTAFYAAELGLFKKYGLDVDLMLFQAGPPMIQGVLSGDLIGGDIGSVPMINLAVQKLPVYFLAIDGYDSPEYPAGAIMVRNDDTSIRSFADLKGKTIGQVAVGTVTYMRLFEAADKYHMKRDDFREVFVPFPNMGNLLASRQVDAVYTWPPFDTLIESAGQGKLLVNDTEWSPYSSASGLVVRREWADKNPEQAKALTKAWIEAGRWVNDNPEKAREIAAKYLKLPNEIAKKMRMLYWPRNGYPLMPSVWDQINMMVATKQIKPVTGVNTMVDDYWIQPAVRWITPAVNELGAQPDPYTDKVEALSLPHIEGAVKQFYGPWRK